MCDVGRQTLRVTPNSSLNSRLSSNDSPQQTPSARYTRELNKLTPEKTMLKSSLQHRSMKRRPCNIVLYKMLPVGSKADVSVSASRRGAEGAKELLGKSKNRTRNNRVISLHCTERRVKIIPVCKL